MARLAPHAILLLALTLTAATAAAAPRVAVLPVEFEGRVPEVRRVGLPQRVGEKLDKLASSLMAHAGTRRSDPARLTVQSEPAGASVTVDGRAAGETPLSLDLSPGAHEVAFVASGHAGTHKKVVLEPGIR